MKKVPIELFHPGEYIAEELEARGWSQAQFAKKLGCSPSTVSRIISGEARITPLMADLIGACFGTDAELWLSLERFYRGTFGIF